MKKNLLLVLLLALLTCQTPLHAAQSNHSGALGLGIILGDPTGLSAKYWLNNVNAFDVSIGFGDVSVHADYLWHRADFFPKPQRGRLLGYLGIGVKVQDQNRKRDTLVGIRGVGGVAYDFLQDPVELFLEVAPVLEMAPDAGLGLDAGFGIRYYFQ